MRNTVMPLRVRVGGSALLSCLLALPLPTFSHHSPAPYRTDQIVAIQGTIASFDWTNPHTYILVDDAEGNSWRIEGNATSLLRRAGWTRDTLNEGDNVTLRINPARNPDHYRGRLLSITTADGRVLSGSSSTETLTTSATTDRIWDLPRIEDLQGIWIGNSEQAVDLLQAYIDHPLTDKGEIAKSEFDDSMAPIAECVAWPTPRLMAWTAFYLSEIELGENIVYIRNEFDETERVVYLDGRAHPDNNEHFSQGYSIGSWNDGTLTVDSSNFSPSRSPVAAGIPSGSQKRVIERFSLAEDGATLELEILVEDPEYLAGPFEARLTWHYLPNTEFVPFECDPEISRRYVE